MDSISEVRLGTVHPLLARKIRQMADILLSDRPPVVLRVTQALRTWQDQEALYAQGRNGTGEVVTNAEPGHSYHQFGLAVDVVPLLLNGQPDWNKKHPVWQRIIDVGRSLGLTEGAQFRSFPDYPHFQLTGKLPVSPDIEVRESFGQSGIPGIWKETGLEENA
jgi:peptidoglycan L-alanyl-D-glutamate endopeptidase CwlK